MSNRPLTAVELASELHEPLFTVLRWSRDGIIPVIDLGYRTKRFDLESVRAALLKRQKIAKRKIKAVSFEGSR